MWFASFVTRAARRRRWVRPVLEWLGPRNLPSQFTGTLAPGEEAACPVTVTQDGRLTAEVTAQGTGAPPLLLTLSGPDGQALVSSVASAPGGAGPRIVQHLVPGTY